MYHNFMFHFIHSHIMMTGCLGIVCGINFKIHSDTLLYLLHISRQFNCWWFSCLIDLLWKFDSI